MKEQPVDGLSVEITPTHQWIRLIHQFLKAFGWLGDSFVLDFFQKNHWNRLPNSWQQFLPSLTPEELATWLDPRDSSECRGWGSSVLKRNIPPLGLTTFKATVRALSLRRNACNLPEFTDDSNADGKCDAVRQFKNFFSKHVKPKKLHEIERFCSLVSNITHRTQCQHVFDVGSGLGHLARFLTYGCNLKLTCVDGNEKFGESATKFDKSLEQFLMKKDIGTFPDPPSHLCAFLEMDKHEHHLQLGHNFGIVGLHSCGNLGPVIIHNFVNSPARFLVSVGCCYMKLDEKGFPLSNFCQEQNVSLSYDSREVACHANEQYCQSILDGCVSKLLTHTYRAALETILVDNFGIVRAGLKGVRHSERMAFNEYAYEAVKNLPDVHLTDDLLRNDRIDSMLKDWYKTVLFYSLRLMLATTVETLVVLDRALFVKEKLPESDVQIVTLFDPYISPRNFAVVVEK